MRGRPEQSARPQGRAWGSSASPRTWWLLACAWLVACAGEPVSGTAEVGSPTIDAHAAPTCACDASGDTACMASTCQADGSCKLMPRREGEPCDDGEPCTFGDRCASGACKAGSQELCACRDDIGCPDDGDLCNGTPFCDKGAFPWRCRTNPATVVTCPAPAKPCRAAQCVPASGACTETAGDEGASCDDGDPCTTGDRCAKGSCAGPDYVCGCETDSDCPDPDGNPCTGVAYCAKGSSGPGSCMINPASVVSCSDKLDTTCRKNVCQPETGTCALLPTAEQQSCDDGDACTSGETCTAGSCGGGTNTCKCSVDADCAGKEDGDACNGTLFCETETGACKLNEATIIFCPDVDETACAKNVCQPETGACKLTPRAQAKLLGCVGSGDALTCKWGAADQPSPGPFACDDGDACTAGDTCEGMVCTPGKPVCACKADADCLPTDDGDLCNGVPYCDVAQGVCKPNPASQVYCNKKDDTDCSKALCDPKTGVCALAGVAISCDDGEVCTGEDACTGGVCKGKPLGAAGCDDGDACTIDSCKAGEGCLHVDKVCNDGNDCTSDGCDAVTGACTQQPAPKETPCDADDDGCTVADACDGTAVCVAGPLLVCTGGSTCKPMQCVGKGSADGTCAPTALADGSPCDDGEPCSLDDVCKGGVCTKGASSALWSFASGVDDAVAGAVHVRDDGDVVVGSMRNGTSGKPWRIDWLRADGKPRHAPLELQPDKTATLGRVVAIVAADADIAVVGGRNVGDKLGSALRLVGSDGTPQTGWVDLSAGEAELTAALQHPGGNLVLAEVTHDANGPKAFRVRMVGLDATPIWSQLVQPVFTPVEVDDVALTPSGGVVYTAASSTKVFSVGVVSASGALVYAVPGVQGPHFPLRTMPLVFDDEAFVFFTHDKDDSPRWNPFGLAENAPLTNRRNIGGTWQPERAVRHGDHAYAFGADKGKPVLVLLDRFGNRQWAREVALPTASRAVELTVDAARGRVVLLATQPKAADLATGWPRPVGTPIVRTVSLFGQATCAGACLGKAPADCDDGKPCLRDDCDAQKGCTHGFEGADVCVPASGCSPHGVCTTGGCVEGATGHWGYVAGQDPVRRGYAALEGSNHWLVTTSDNNYTDRYRMLSTGARSLRVIMTSAIRNVGAVLAPPGGGMLAVGTDTANPNTPQLLRRGFDAQDTDTIVTPQGCKGCGVRPVAAALRGDGRVVAAYRYLSTAKSDQVWACVVEPKTGTTEASWSIGFGTTTTIGGLAADGYGQALAVGRAGAAGKNATAALVRLGPDVGAPPVTLGTSQDGTELVGVATTAIASSVAVGWRTFANGSVRAAAIGVDTPLGKAPVIAWIATGNPFAGVRLVGVVAADGGYVAIGRKEGGTTDEVVLTRRLAGADFAPLWTRTVDTFSSGIDLTPNNLVALPDGAFLFGTTTFGSSGPRLYRVNSGGVAACADAGKCADHAGTCDDEDACTADWCDPSAGCKHAPIAGPGCKGG